MSSNDAQGNAVLWPYTNKIPNNIFRPFTVDVGTGQYHPVMFLPSVLWAGPGRNGGSMFLEEFSALKRNPPPRNIRTQHQQNRSAGSSSSPNVDANTALLSYSLKLPYCLRYAQNGYQLPTHDMLYYMESFFGHNLIDRTGVLTRSIQVKVLDPIPQLDPTFSKPFPTVCLERARQIWERAERQNMNVKLLWSGGIDSTTALVAMLRVTARNDRRLSRLIVTLTRDSINEYSSFYYNHIQKYVKVENLRDLSDVYKPRPGERPFLVVTGELGDQICGSMHAQLCFRSYTRSPRERMGNLFTDRLNDGWRNFMPSMLVHYRVIPASAMQDWLRWIEPQVQKAPIPIVTVFDMLWWLNYSMKWQHVTLRIIFGQDELSSDMFDRTEHFFRHPDFEQWSFHNHNQKIPNPGDWLSYKVSNSIAFGSRMSGIAVSVSCLLTCLPFFCVHVSPICVARLQFPLKQFIYEFTKDKRYRDKKSKEPSLRFVKRKNSYERGLPTVLGVTENFERVYWGQHSITLDRLLEKYGAVLQGMVRPEADLAEQDVQHAVWQAADARKVLEKAYVRKPTLKQRMLWFRRARVRDMYVDEGILEAMHSAAAIWAFTHQPGYLGITSSTPRRYTISHIFYGGMTLE